MNKTAILHIPESNYCFPLSKDEMVFRLRVDKNDNNLKIYLIAGFKYDFLKNSKKYLMNLKYSDELFSYYEIKIKVNDSRIGYIFEINDNNKIYYLSEKGIEDKFDFNTCNYNIFHFPFINENDVIKEIDWMKKSVFYQIFVDRFYIGNKGKKYINMKWDDKPKFNSFAGGDLKGIMEKLPYLKKLGINAIYLTPIFKAGTNHKYDSVDYFKIDKHFGNETDMKNLVEYAHKLNIKIVLDAVFNHCSNEHRFFKDVIKKGKNSKYYNYFIIKGEKVDISKANYQMFANVKEMPKLNTSNKNVQNYLIKIGKYWIEKFDIDGWRLDVSDEVSHNFWKIFRNEIKKIKNDAVLIGENWHNAYSFLKGDEFDSIMNYKFTRTLIDFFTNDDINISYLVNKLNEILITNYSQINKMNLNLIGSHDTTRILTECNGNKDKVLIMYLIMFMYIGVPMIYYGDEIAMEGKNDPDCRRGFNWDEKKWDINFHKKIKEIIKLKKIKEIIDGEISISEKKGLLEIKRYINDKYILAYINLSNDKMIYEVKGTLLISNKYERNFIEKYGYVVIKSN